MFGTPGSPIGVAVDANCMVYVGQCDNYSVCVHLKGPYLGRDQENLILVV